MAEKTIEFPHKNSADENCPQRYVTVKLTLAGSWVGYCNVCNKRIRV